MKLKYIIPSQTIVHLVENEAILELVNTSGDEPTDDFGSAKGMYSSDDSVSHTGRSSIWDNEW